MDEMKESIMWARLENMQRMLQEVAEEADKFTVQELLKIKRLKLGKAEIDIMELQERVDNWDFQICKTLLKLKGRATIQPAKILGQPPKVDVRIYEHVRDSSQVIAFQFKLGQHYDDISEFLSCDIETTQVHYLGEAVHTLTICADEAVNGTGDIEVKPGAYVFLRKGDVEDFAVMDASHFESNYKEVDCGCPERSCTCGLEFMKSTNNIKDVIK